MNKEPEEDNELDQLIKLLKGSGFGEFLRYLQSPWRIMWTNFLAGMFRGLGILIGMSVIVGLLIWLLTQLVNLPLIGEYFQMVIDLLQSIQTNTQPVSDPGHTPEPAEVTELDIRTNLEGTNPQDLDSPLNSPLPITTEQK